MVDLFYERGKNTCRAKEEEREAAKNKLKGFIRKHEPQMIVAVLNRIHKYVEKAVGDSGVKVEVKCLPFPRGKYRRKYIKECAQLLRDLRS